MVPTSADFDLYSQYNTEEVNFIKSVETSEGFSIENSNIHVDIDSDGQFTIIEELNGEFNIYSAVSVSDSLENMENGAETRGVISTLIGLFKLAWKVIGVVGEVQLVCTTLDGISGWDGCGYLLKEFRKFGEATYRVTRTFHKSPNCAPYYSYHCSTAAGGAYWKTNVVRV